VSESLHSIKNHIISGKNSLGNNKIKKVKIKVTLEQVTNDQRGSRCVALLFL
jgi:hypothetical protein